MLLTATDAATAAAALLIVFVQVIVSEDAWWRLADLQTDASTDDSQPARMKTKISQTEL